MDKSVAKIFNLDGSKGIGFFCKIPLSKNKNIPFLISNYHVIKEGTEIEYKIHKEKNKKINLENKFKYASPLHDIYILEIKEEESNIEYLELDENVLNANNLSYIGNSTFIIHYPNNYDKVAVSYGIIKGRFEDKKYSFRHFSHTEKGSSGSPILNLSNNKIIGWHS